MAQRVYATEAHLVAWLDDGATAPSGANRMLRNASAEVDRLLVTAIYDTDGDGAATDQDVIGALRDATCELVSWWLQTGDEHGTASYGGTATIGSVTVGGGSGGAGATPRVGPHVLTILSNAGLLGHEPLQYR
jgi:hypothetical protein